MNVPGLCSAVLTALAVFRPPQEFGWNSVQVHTPSVCSTNAQSTSCCFMAFGATCTCVDAQRRRAILGDISFLANAPPCCFAHPTPPLKSDSLNRESCKKACGSKGFPFFGLEWSIVCYCGGKEAGKETFIDMLDKYRVDDESCGLPCPKPGVGDTCGGSGFIEIGEV